MVKAVVIVPCFEEASRLVPERFLAMLGEGDELRGAPTLHLLFVDDGSGDDTFAVLEKVRAACPERVQVLGFEKNRGKGEAVRQGMLEALAGGADIVGYTDADLSTPPTELRRLLDFVGEGRPSVSVVVGSRVLLVGKKIVRKRTRHVLGRVFATLAAEMLRAPFYDTQCGAKLFRDNATLRAALGRPFISRWAFDVELLGRLLVGLDGVEPVPETQFIEVPLDEWVDTAESRLRFGAMLRTLLDLARIDVELRRLRTKRSRG